jgi:hypothetical protein
MSSVSNRAHVIPLFPGQLLLTALNVCSQNSSGHKTVKFGRNAHLHWDYNLTKNHLILRQSGCDLC